MPHLIGMNLCILSSPKCFDFLWLIYDVSHWRYQEEPMVRKCLEVVECVLFLEGVDNCKGGSFKTSLIEIIA